MLTLPPPPPAIVITVDLPRVLECISQVEGHQWSDPKGRYAITYACWREHTSKPYRLVHVRKHAYPVAISHLVKLSAQLRRHDYPVSPYTLAACWNLGFEGFRRSPRVLNYATRVTSLYHDPSFEP